MDRQGLKGTKRLDVGREFRWSRLADQWAAWAYEGLIPIDRQVSGSMGCEDRGSRWPRSIGLEEQRCRARA